MHIKVHLYSLISTVMQIKCLLRIWERQKAICIYIPPETMATSYKYIHMSHIYIVECHCHIIFYSKGGLLPTPLACPQDIILPLSQTILIRE